MPRNDTAALSHVCPDIRIHPIDIVQPPGMSIPPIADMEVHQKIVSVALAMKRSAETPKKARLEVRGEAKPASMLRQIVDSKVWAMEVAGVIMLSPFAASASVFIFL